MVAHIISAVFVIESTTEVSKLFKKIETSTSTYHQYISPSNKKRTHLMCALLNIFMIGYE